MIGKIFMILFFVSAIGSWGQASGSSSPPKKNEDITAQIVGKWEIKYAFGENHLIEFYNQERMLISFNGSTILLRYRIEKFEDIYLLTATPLTFYKKVSPNADIGAPLKFYMELVDPDLLFFAESASFASSLTNSEEKQDWTFERKK